MVSFESISAVGANAAVIHYRPTELTDARINDQEVYLLDSGGQYLWVQSCMSKELLFKLYLIALPFTLIAYVRYDILVSAFGIV
jgi:hypothetical protein